MSENEKNLKKEKAQLRKLLDQNARGIKLLDSILGTDKSTGRMGTKKKEDSKSYTLAKSRKSSGRLNSDDIQRAENSLSGENKFTKRRRTLSGKKK